MKPNYIFRSLIFLFVLALAVLAQGCRSDAAPAPQGKTGSTGLSSGASEVSDSEARSSVSGASAGAAAPAASVASDASVASGGAPSAENSPLGLGGGGGARGEMPDWWKEFTAYRSKRTREHLADNERRAPGGIVFLGDSLVDWFPVERYFPQAPVINRGIAGERVGDRLRPHLRGRLDWSVADLKPRAVFLMCGVNDLMWPDVATADVEEGYRMLLADLRKAAPGARVYVHALLPTRGEYARHNARIREFNPRLKKIAEEFACSYLDFHAEFCDAAGELDPAFTTDGLHLSEAGHARWAKLLRPWVCESLAASISSSTGPDPRFLGADGGS